MFIYKITNKINGKVYIGQTKQEPSKRWEVHKYSSQKIFPIQKAISKYGIANFTFEVIDGANSQSELNYREDHYIHLHNSLSPNGYNLRLNSKLFPETRKKQSLRAIERVKREKETLKTYLNRGREKIKNKIKAVEVATGKVLIFSSIQEVKMIGATPWKVSSMVRGLSAYVEHVGYYFEYLDKNTVKNIQTKRIDGGVLRIDRISGDTKEYGRLCEVKIDGFSVTTINRYLKGHRKNNSMYEWRYIRRQG